MGSQDISSKDNSIHGVICRKDGERVTVTIGEDDTDPVAMVSDLLPQSQRFLDSRL